MRSIYPSDNPIEGCYNFAIEHGFSVFAVQNDNECFTAADAAETYQQYGRGSLCYNGKGAPYLQNVYHVTCQGNVKLIFKNQIARVIIKVNKKSYAISTSMSK